MSDPVTFVLSVAVLVALVILGVSVILLLLRDRQPTATPPGPGAPLPMGRLRTQDYRLDDGDDEGVIPLRASPKDAI